MDIRNIFAYTEIEYDSYPAYISLNNIDGKVIMSVRSKESSVVSSIEIPFDELGEMGINILKLFI